MESHVNTIERFYSLDALRGVAALSIVLWHWQHFFYVGTQPGNVELTDLPLAACLLPFYANGWIAVDLFFCLSGFVFYWLYSQRVASGSISFGRFALLRISRLYPLHLATLVFVAACQLWLTRTRGSSFVYPNNDVGHFLLNLLFASSWGVEKGYSFNGPAWSVSVEVVLYALFFALCRLLPVRALYLAVASAVGYLLIQNIYTPIGRGIGSFFLGGTVFLAYKTIIGSSRFHAVTVLVAILTLGAWMMTFVVSLYGIDLPLLSAREPPALSWPILVLFPVTILALALAETYRGTLGKRISFLGDISYSSYLLHFPLQLTVQVLAPWLGLGESVYYSPLSVGLFYAVLVTISLGSYRYLEIPAQSFLRRFGSTQVQKRNS